MMEQQIKSTPQPQNKSSDIQIKTSITDLPLTVLVEILVKLGSVKRILRCKSVCKSWRGMISSCEFAKAHSAQGSKEFFTLIRDIHHSKISRRFQLFEDETLKDVVDGDDQLWIEFETKNAVDHRNESVSSCNGLLCLYKLGHFFGRDMVFDPIVVCNPVTGEFSYLPNTCYKASLKAVEFGFSPKHDEYKVIRVLRKWINYPKLSGHFDVAEIHTLGTESWRKLDSWPTELGFFDSPAYLDGAFHWPLRKINDNGSMVSFYLKDERCQVHTVPFKVLTDSTLRAQGGRLYMFNTSRSRAQIWVMNKNGDPELWTQLFSINFSRLQFFTAKYIKLVLCIDDEAAVFFHCLSGKFMCYERSKGLRYTQSEFPSSRSNFEVLSYTPSFIFLKDIVRSDNVDILNVNWCVKLPLKLGGQEAS